MGVVASRIGQGTQIGAEIAAARGTEVFGVAKTEIDRSPSGPIAQIMHGAAELVIAGGGLPTLWAWALRLTVLLENDVRAWKILRSKDGALGFVLAGADFR